MTSISSVPISITLMQIDTIVLSKLILDEEYCRKVLPFIKQEYFEDYTLKVIFDEISTYVDKYEGLPEATAIAIGIDKRQDVNESTYKEIISFLGNLTRINTTKNGCMILQRNGAKNVRSISLSWRASRLQMGKTRHALRMLSLLSCRKHLEFVLMIMLDTTTYWTRTTGMTTITERKKRFPSISNISTRSQKVVSLIKLSTSLLLVRASGSLYSCAMSLVPASCKGAQRSLHYM